jgi:F1F0 ATPase subunit 2
MAMSETMSLAFACATGALLGAMFFGGLWWTVRRGMTSRRPGFWFIGSLLLRISTVMAGFYFLLGLPGANWKILLAGLAGFVAARLAATRLFPVPLSMFPPELPAGKPGLNTEAQRGGHGS